MELFKTVPAYFTAFFLFLQLLRFSYKRIKPIFFFDVSEILGLTIVKPDGSGLPCIFLRLGRNHPDPVS